MKMILTGQKEHPVDTRDKVTRFVLIHFTIYNAINLKLPESWSIVPTSASNAIQFTFLTTVIIMSPRRF